MVDHPEQQIAERCSGQAADQQRLVVNERAQAERRHTGQGLVFVIQAKPGDGMKNQQEQGRRAQDLPEHTLRGELCIAIGDIVPSGDEDAIAAPAHHDGHYKMEDFKQRLRGAGLGIVVPGQRENNAWQRRPAIEEHQA